MQEAFKVVSSPRWQTQNTEDRTNTSETPAADTGAQALKQDEDSKSSDATETIEARSTQADDTPNTTDSDSETAERADDAVNTMEKVDDPEAVSTTPAARTYDPPSVMETAKSPLLAIATACATVAAVWSYTSLEDTRAQLATVTSAKATLERSLAEAQSKLAVAEKTVADVKAAIGAATAAPAKATSGTATK